MRFASLGSGSQGNALVVDAGDTRVLLDCGFSTRETLERLARLSVGAETISAILVTHEHSDHVAGVFRLARRLGIPVYLSHGTHAVVAGGKQSVPECVECRLIDSHTTFSIGDLEVSPYPVPHDAREPVQYTFSDGQHRLGVLTDSGTITAHIVEVLGRCDALVLECNHDAQLLSASDYPPMLKRRIASNLGHLENSQAAELLQRVERKQLQHIVAAHLSEQNNTAALATRALAEVLSCADDWIGVATQSEGIDWRQLL